MIFGQATLKMPLNKIISLITRNHKHSHKLIVSIHFVNASFQIFSLHLGHGLRVIFLTLTLVCVRADAQDHVDVSVCHVTPPSGYK